MSSSNVLGLVFFVSGVAVALSLLGVPVPPPESWLVQWTGWIGSVVGIIVGSRVLWSGASLMLSKAKGG